MKAPNRRLKVFEAQLGFYDTVVAAPSRAAALRAWGIHQDLFATGVAKLTTDEALVAVATAHPETPLLRPVGSNGPFVVKPTTLPDVPEVPRKKAGKSSVKNKAAPRVSPPADRSRLTAAEEALRQLDERRARAEADFRREGEEFEARRAAAESAYSQARKAAKAKVADARTAYRDAGGED